MSSEQVMLICRGCLSSEHKLINATLYESEYKDLTGIIVSKKTLLAIFFIT